MRTGLVILPVVALLLAAGPAVAQADELLATEPAPVAVSAAGDAAAWSDFDALAGVWYLVVRRAATVERVPVAPRGVPFDVDLGRDAAHHLVAAYSRCDVDPSLVAPRGHGCDIYAFDLDRGGPEELLPGSTESASETLPSVSGNRIAFVRVRERRAAPAGVRSSIFVRDLAEPRPRRVPGGTRNDDPRTGPTALDLDGRRVAIAWSTAGSAGPVLPYGAAELYVDEVGGGSVRGEQLARSDLRTADVITPQLQGDDLRYGVTTSTEGEPAVDAVRTLDLTRGRRTTATVPPSLAAAAQLPDGTLIQTCAPGAGSCALALRTGLTWTDPDPVLADPGRPVMVSAYGGWLAYSVATGDRSYRLTLRAPDGTAITPAVAPRRTPFDVDLGPDAAGRLTAVYSRCRRDPRTDPEDRLPVGPTGRDCDVFQLTVASGQEHRVRVASRSTASEWSPAIWRDHLAFASRARRGPVEVRLGTVGGRGSRVLSRGADPRAIDLFGTTAVVAGPVAVTLLRPGRPAARLAHGAHLLAPAIDGAGVRWIERRPGRATTLVSTAAPEAPRRVSLLPGPVLAFRVDAATWCAAAGLRPAGRPGLRPACAGHRAAVGPVTCARAPSRRCSAPSS